MKLSEQRRQKILLKKDAGERSCVLSKIARDLTGLPQVSFKLAFNQRVTIILCKNDDVFKFILIETRIFQFEFDEFR